MTAKIPEYAHHIDLHTQGFFIFILCTFLVRLYSYSIGTTTFPQNQLTGMTSTIAGIISATGKLWIFAMRKPVARRRKPPQALKSAIISGVVSGKMNFAAAKIARKITHYGIATAATTIPRVPPKIIAVKKSRMDLEMRIVWSPLIPESREP